MEFTELAVSNFKRFSDERWVFGPGLNLIWGPNESGKSTIHEAICCALFGRERGQNVENWNGGSCVVKLTYRQDGRTWQIERRLTKGVARLGVLTDGELVDVITAKDDLDQTIVQHLGIRSKDVFDNTVSVRQTGVSAIKTSDMEAVGGEIQRVLTGTAHVSAAEVLERLKRRRDEIRGRARPTNPRELDRITSRLQELSNDLANARRSRETINNLEEELAELEERTAKDSERLRELEELLDRHRRWSELREREAEADERHRNAFTTLRRIEDTLHDLSSAQKELEGYADFVGRDEEIEDHLRKVESREVELTTRLNEFEATRQDARATSSRSRRRLILGSALVLAAAGIVAGLLYDKQMLLLLLPALVLAIVYAFLAGVGRTSDSEHLASMIESTKEELRQLALEEQSILNYVKCQSRNQALQKIRHYRELGARTKQLEATLNALLNGRSREDWQAQEAELARALSGIRRELEDFAGYSPTTEETERWRTEYASLQSSLPSAQARLHEVRGSLEAERRNARDLASLEGELEFLHSRKAELEFTHRAYEEAIQALNTVTETISREYLPRLSEQASEYMRRITSGRYTSVNVQPGQPGWQIALDCRDRSAVQPDVVSIGTLDQLYFALRVACGELLSAGRRLPVILDDPFASFDRDRLDNVLDVLGTLGSDQQIILMTHDPYVLDWAQNLESGAGCTVHTLQA